jgi:hypothetical protein
MEPSIVSNQIPFDSQKDNGSGQTPSVQFFVRMGNQSKPRDITLSATMDSLVEIVMQVTGVPREFLRINIGKHVWTNSNPGSSSIMDFGFVAKCTLEISVMGKAGSKSGSQTKTDISSNRSDPEFSDEPEFSDLDLDSPLDTSTNLATPAESDDDSDSDDNDYSALGDESSSESDDLTNGEKEKRYDMFPDVDPLLKIGLHPLVHDPAAQIVIVISKTAHWPAVQTIVDHVHLPVAKATFLTQLDRMNSQKRAGQRVVFYFQLIQTLRSISWYQSGRLLCIKQR